MAEVLNDNNFEEKTKDGITLIDFYADWCGPCRIVGPIVDELSKDLTDVNVVKVDVDESPQTAMKFGIRTIPTIVLLKDGKEVNRAIGIMSKPQLLQFIKSA
ncbi:MAG: thioredoxin [bacterium]